jgi:1-phosphofructokinase family hexose kinase
MRTVTLTLHPAIDRILEVDHLEPGGTFSTRLLQSVPAGKGVNTARSLSALLRPSGIVAAAWIGAGEAAWFAKSLRENNGVQTSLFLRDHCATRQAYTFMEKTGRETHLKETMPPPERSESTALAKQWEKTLRKADLVAFCGSAPAKTPHSVIEKVLSTAQKRAHQVVADTNGAALESAAKAGLYGIKGNALEFGELLNLGRPLDLGNSAHRKKIAALQPPRGPQVIVMTMGSRGAAYLAGGAIHYAAPPKLARSQIKAATGCGDAATAGWLWAIQQNCSPEETLRRIVACGTAKVTSLDPGFLDRALVRKLVRAVSVKRL